MSHPFQYTEDDQVANSGRFAWRNGHQQESCPYKDDHRKSVWLNAFKEARKQSLKKKVEISDKE